MHHSGAYAVWERSSCCQGLYVFPVYETELVQEITLDTDLLFNIFCPPQTPDWGGKPVLHIEVVSGMGSSWIRA